MPITSTATIYNRHTGATETLPADQAALKTFYQRDEWSSIKPPPLNWETEIPRYRVTRDLKPAEKNRFRFEPPFSETWESDTWQYGDRPYVAGNEISTTAWPHPSFRPLNYGAERVLEFYKASTKSRLQLAPWHQGRVRLETGIGGTLPDLHHIIAKPPQEAA
jgi:hypothetical protein